MNINAFAVLMDGLNGKEHSSSALNAMSILATLDKNTLKKILDVLGDLYEELYLTKLLLAEHFEDTEEMEEELRDLKTSMRLVEHEICNTNDYDRQDPPLD